MNDSSLIHDFLDGTLNSIQEDEFFMKLYSNEDLRSELKQFINMDKAFNKKLSTFVPSAKSTLAVFSALGINSPVIPPIQTTIPNISPVVPGFFKKYSQGIYSGLLASAVTAALFLAFFGNVIFNDGKSDFVEINKNNKTKLEQTENPPKTENKIPVSDKKTKIITKVVYVPIEKISENNNSNRTQELIEGNDKQIETAKNPLVLLNESQIIQDKKVNFDAMKLNDKYSKVSPINFNSKTILKSLSINNPIGLTIGIKTGQYWQLQNVPISQSTIPSFYNTGINLGYKITNKFSLDLDIRNEHYYQQFEGVDEIGNKYLYKQYPNYTSFTAGCKWNFVNYESFGTYSQLMIGGTATGYIGRAVLGFEYSPQPEFKFIIDLEGSCLGYGFQGNTFYSPKFGINYGVAFNF